jgi:hypothetical protein
MISGAEREITNPLAFRESTEILVVYIVECENTSG